MYNIISNITRYNMIQRSETTKYISDNRIILYDLVYIIVLHILLTPNFFFANYMDTHQLAAQHVLEPQIIYWVQGSFVGAGRSLLQSNVVIAWTFAGVNVKLINNLSSGQEGAKELWLSIFSINSPLSGELRSYFEFPNQMIDKCMIFQQKLFDQKRTTLH